MANTLITPSIIAKESLFQLKNNLVMGNLVHRDYSREFAKVGSTISIRKPVRFKAQTGATRVNQDVLEGTVPIVLDQRKHVSWNFSTQELTLTVEEYSERYIKPAMIELAQQVETSLMGLYATVPSWVGTAGTTPSTFLALGAARQRLVEQRAPMGDTLNAVLDPAAALLIANDLKNQFQPGKQLTAMERVKIGKYAGFDTYEGQSVLTHTVGSKGGSPLVNGANQHSNASPRANSQTLVLDGATASQAGWAKAGDVITINGVFAINGGTRQAYTYLKQFTVLSDAASDGSGNVTLTISPAIVSDTASPYQNVSAVPADNAAVTVVTGTASTAYSQNLCFHKNAFALVMADLELPDGAAFKAREAADNLSVRVVKDYDIDADTDIIRLDILYGVKTIYEDLATRLTG
jgi:P22 coat protein - gene protein 5